MLLVCPTCRSVLDGKVTNHWIGDDFICRGCGFAWPFLEVAGQRIGVFLPAQADRDAALATALEVQRCVRAGSLTAPTTTAAADALQLLATYAPAHWGNHTQPRLPAADLSWIDAWLPTDMALPPGPILVLGAGAGGELSHLHRGDRAIIALDASLPLLTCAATAAQPGSSLPFRPAAGELALATLHLPAPARAALGRTILCCANALDPPFAAGTMAAIIACNLLDSVSNPLTLLGQCEALLAPGGALLLSSPYHWRDEVTPVDRRPQRLWPAGVDIHDGMEALLTGQVLPGFLSNLKMLRSERDLPWMVTLHPRAAVRYSMHVILLVKDLMQSVHSP